MTRNNRAFHVVRGLSVLASSLALVIAAIGTTVAHPTTAVQVATSVQEASLRDFLTARILLIEPGITADELDELVDQIIDHVEDGDEADVDESEVEEPEVEEAEVEAPAVEAPEVDDADEPEVDDADEPEVDDADEPEVDDADEPEDDDDDDGAEADEGEGDDEADDDEGDDD